MAYSFDAKINKVKNDIIFDLDTIRIENTGIDTPEESYKLLKLLNEVQGIVKERFENISI